ncbi:MAG TPA: hypothetical protein VLB44_13000, partial [Kofleriaceae bacterium]|nr:hypothetical protein [Kofleriaceae bacterium]
VDGDVPDAALDPLLRPTEIRIDHDYQAAIRARYRSETFTELIAPETGLWSVPIAGTTPAPASQREAIDRAWSEIVWAHPGAYLRYRFDTFAEILGLRSKFQGMTVIQRRAQQPERMVAMRLTEQPSKFQLRVERVLVQFRKTLLFRPHLYALLALILLPFAWRQRDVLALLLSGLAMELSLLVFASTPDFRYSLWLVVCVCVSLVMLVARRARGAG